MTEDEVIALFKHHDNEYLKSDRIISRFSWRDDLHAFILLDHILGIGIENHCDIVDHAEHDEIYLEPTPWELAEAGITEEQIIDLIRCGVIVREGQLMMNV
jgi:hypothetical protein